MINYALNRKEKYDPALFSERLRCSDLATSLGGSRILVQQDSTPHLYYGCGVSKGVYT